MERFGWWLPKKMKTGRMGGKREGTKVKVVGFKF
jgi:hypothetical protein